LRLCQLSQRFLVQGLYFTPNINVNKFQRYVFKVVSELDEKTFLKHSTCFYVNKQFCFINIAASYIHIRNQYVSEMIGNNVHIHIHNSSQVYLCHELCIVFTFFSAVIFILQLVISVTFGEGRSTKSTARQEKCVQRNTSGVVAPFFPLYFIFKYNFKNKT
jgi:hypothetical protein